MEYAKAALSAISLISIASALAPSREGLRRATLSAFSVILLVLLIPRGELDFSSLFSFGEADIPEESAPAYSEAWKAGVENGIRDDISSRFSLDKEDIAVSCTLLFEENEVEITHLSLTLSGDGVRADATGMLRYIEKNYGVFAELHLQASPTDRKAGSPL